MVFFNYFTVPVIACGGEDSKVNLFTEKDEKVTMLVHITCTYPSILSMHMYHFFLLLYFFTLFVFNYLFLTCWQFVKVQSLLGHEDWIRGVEFALEGWSLG